MGIRAVSVVDMECADSVGEGATRAPNCGRTEEMLGSDEERCETDVAGWQVNAAVGDVRNESPELGEPINPA